MGIFDKPFGRRKKQEEPMRDEVSQKNTVVMKIEGDDNISVRDSTTDELCNIIEAHDLAVKGVEYEKIGQWKRAIKQYKRAIELSPNDPSISIYHTNLGVCYAQIGKIDAAVKELETALKIKPSYERARENLQVVKQLRGY